MFEFDAGKLILIAIVALIVIGPKDLPRVLRQIGQAVGKMRRMAAEFQGQFMEAMREADVADAKADVEKLAQIAKVDVPPLRSFADLESEIKSALDAPEPPRPAAAPAPALALASPADEAAAGASSEAGQPPDEKQGAADGKDAIDAEMKALAEALKAEIDPVAVTPAPPAPTAETNAAAGQQEGRGP